MVMVDPIVPMVEQQRWRWPGSAGGGGGSPSPTGGGEQVVHMMDLIVV